MQHGFSSRLGFILVSAGCAIGLGNVWRFPYITGKYGGATFVLFYLLFLIILGLPIVLCEFAVGRGSRMSVAGSFDVLEPKGTKWHVYKYVAIAGNTLLMMFYTTISGWMVYYFLQMIKGTFNGLNASSIGDVFTTLLADPVTMIGCMVFTVVACFCVCLMGIQKGVERITKVMMVLLIILMVVLAINSLLLPNASKGLEYYLLPDWNRFKAHGVSEAIFAAMGQAFFTLSLGIGAMSIFGSYIGKERSLLGESLNIALLDTFVAITSGLIIFPACFTFNVDQTSGPGLIFITLPNIFNHIPMGRLWGSLFFVFMSFAAFSTILAVFENIISCGMELTGWSRKKSSFVNAIAITLLSIPCVLGYNLWSWDGFAVFGGAVLDFEDFLVSNLFLPLGSLVYLLFCTSRYGWGWKNFTTEANTGKGLKMQNWMRGYITYILPLIVLFIFFFGLYDKFF